MNRRNKRIAAACTAIALLLCGCDQCVDGNVTADPAVVAHVVVYRAAERFAGWPANNGAWAWGNELLVGFTEGAFKDNLFGHDIDEWQPSYPRFARSLDGGETWTVEVPSFLDAQGAEAAPRPPEGGIDFSHPGFAMTLRMVSSQSGFSRFYWSKDRGRIWEGPFALPDYGRKGIAARTDYLIDGPTTVSAFLTASKTNGKEGRPFVTRTEDGGLTWNFVGWITPEPEGFAIMPSTVRLADGSLVSAIRYSGAEDKWIEIWGSADNGSTWTYLSTPAAQMGGNPPSMLQLPDSRLALTYGYRNCPAGIRARLSDDGGRTWGREIILRADGGNWDVGYPRTLLREDGNLVTIYYFNDDAHAERYIAATIWDPRRIESTPR
ncbi:MAG: exo-alpha-sialidase [Candidatus Hydrogenedentes bacterium]|nr:exo-alpha-sialidase [Candidatus Hydrogenedentota bacterium]